MKNSTGDGFFSAGGHTGNPRMERAHSASALFSVFVERAEFEFELAWLLQLDKQQDTKGIGAMTGKKGTPLKKDKKIEAGKLLKKNSSPAAKIQPLMKPF